MGGARAAPAEGASPYCMLIVQHAQPSYTSSAHLFPIDPTPVSTLLSRCSLHRSIRQSRAHGMYESTETTSYHHTTPPSPRELLATSWVSCAPCASWCSDRAPRAAAAAARRRRAGDGGGGAAVAERRRRRAAGRSGSQTGHGQPEAPRRRPFFE